MKKKSLRELVFAFLSKKEGMWSKWERQTRLTLQLNKTRRSCNRCNKIIHKHSKCMLAFLIERSRDSEFLHRRIINIKNNRYFPHVIWDLVETYYFFRKALTRHYSSRSFALTFNKASFKSILRNVPIHSWSLTEKNNPFASECYPQ